MPERKPRSGTILDFGLRILDSKKKAISVRLAFSSKTGTPRFEVFVQRLGMVYMPRFYLALIPAS